MSEYKRLKKQHTEAEQAAQQAETALNDAIDARGSAYSRMIDQQAAEQIGDASKKEADAAAKEYETILKRIDAATLDRDKKARVVELLKPKLDQARLAERSRIEAEITARIPSAVANLVTALAAVDAANQTLADLRNEARARLGNQAENIVPPALADLHSPKNRIDSFTLSTQWNSAQSWINQYSPLIKK